MQQYDVIIVGGGIAGLWLGNRLLRAGYDVVVIEKDQLGAGQTLAAQGMIHGGQKYLLRGALTAQAASLSQMPQRWGACFEGRGEIDLSAVRILNETQVMWPAGSILSAATVLAAARLANAKPSRLADAAVPQPLRHGRKPSRPVYELPERVLDMRSLVLALAANMPGRVLNGEATEVSPQGRVVVSDHTLSAQAVVFAAGTGNERALDVLGAKEPASQRRPLRQVMVRPLPCPLFGHGIAASAQPRVTVTSHAYQDRQYIWYLGGNVAEEGARLDEAEALRFAKAELVDIFPSMGWEGKEWATWCADRAEPLDTEGQLPPGPHVVQHGRILVAWPTKLTFAPALADLVMARLNDLKPLARSAGATLPPATIGAYPWEVARWRRLA